MLGLRSSKVNAPSHPGQVGECPPNAADLGWMSTVGSIRSNRPHTPLPHLSASESDPGAIGGPIKPGDRPIGALFNLLDLTRLQVDPQQLLPVVGEQNLILARSHRDRTRPANVQLGIALDGRLLGRIQRNGM